MRIKHRAISILLAVVMTLAVLAGCGPAQPASTTPAPATDPVTPATTAEITPATDPVTTPETQTPTTAAVATTAGTTAAPASVTVTDAAGRTVELDQPVESILTVYAMRYILALGLADKLVNGSSRPFDLAVHPGLADGVTFGGEQLNAESIASINPDVFIHRSSAGELMEALDKLGIDSIGVYMETPDEVVATIELLGKALGVEKRAADLVAYYRKLMGVGSELTANVAQSDKPTAILMGNTIGKVAHGSMLQSIMIESAGGVNLAKDVQGEGTWPVVGVEKIFEWDPEFIFIMNSTSRDYDAESIMADPAWAKLQAVKNKNVFVVPSDLDSWEFPAVQSALGTVWMVSKMHPELLSDQELERHVNEFYDFVYGVKFDRDKLKY